MPGKDETSDGPPYRRWAWTALRWGILVIVVAGVGRRIWLERERLAAYDQPIGWWWLVASGTAYAVGLLPCAAFWRRAMLEFGPAPGWMRTLAAYFAGHLGKYVPGKGLVVVIRAGMVRRDGVAVATGAITCALETLLMMATGALVAALMLVTTEVPSRRILLAASVGLALVLGFFVVPRVVSKWSAVIARPFGPATAAAPSLGRAIAVGAASITIGWLLMGCSFACVLAAMGEWGNVVADRGQMAAAGLVTAVIALATVGGFISLTPGGLGSREWILVETLGPVTGSEKALIAAVLLRLSWIAAEAAATGLFWTLDARWKPRNDPSR